VAIIAAEQRGEQQATPAEKTEEEIEEDKYREMQNFDEYSKINKKISKLTLASLMKGNLNARAHARVCACSIGAMRLRGSSILAHRVGLLARFVLNNVIFLKSDMTSSFKNLHSVFLSSIIHRPYPIKREAVTGI